MSSDDESRKQQELAIRHAGSPARLLAGPGTGKTWTLTERVIHLIRNQEIPSNQILALTFTRAASQELRRRVQQAVGEDAIPPRVATLHSYALRQLLRNAPRYQNLPQPLRILDDWEERWIVQEDLKEAMAERTAKPFRVEQIRDLLRRLASDWESLAADNEDWRKEFPDPDFLGVWYRHRNIYGYTLRSELVYQLKTALFLHGDFELDGIPEHLLVDEFQDLNPCDLAVVHWMREQGSELFAAGDDDQSIYGFRNAYPFGIRRLVDEVPGTADLRLEYCRRCDTSILQLADFVIRLDPSRVAKVIRTVDEAAHGEVKLARYGDQHREARAIAAKCRELVDTGLQPAELLILLRQDRHGAFSSVLASALNDVDVPVNVDIQSTGMFSEKASGGGRQLLALLRLAHDSEDSIAWRTLLYLDKNRFGPAVKSVIEAVCEAQMRTLARALFSNRDAPLFGSHSARLSTWVTEVLADIEAIRSNWDTSSVEPDQKHDYFKKSLAALPRPNRIQSEEEFQQALTELGETLGDGGYFDLDGLISEIGVAKTDEEQVIDPTKVNILTMHKAKGLGVDTVFIACAEDEYLPGGAASAAELADERRLLYVSLTRAKHRLYITYCDSRQGGQLFTGTAAGNPFRTITRFLKDAGLVPTQL